LTTETKVMCKKGQRTTETKANNDREDRKG